jgi:hypothetical protein
MLRHLGLVTAAPAGLSRQRNQLANMIAELAYLLESLNSSIGSTHGEEKKESETSAPRKRKKVLSPSIIGLEAATFSDFFEILIHVVVAATATSNPVLQGGTVCSPYQSLQESFVFFRRLIEVYQRHVAVFPRMSAAVVSNVSYEMLSVAVSQLQRCVDWLNS